jgi:hypothetical protein
MEVTENIIWTKTLHLRLETRGVAKDGSSVTFTLPVLQQLFTSNKGGNKWVDVPIVNHKPKQR